MRIIFDTTAKTLINRVTNKNDFNRIALILDDEFKKIMQLVLDEKESIEDIKKLLITTKQNRHAINRYEMKFEMICMVISNLEKLKIFWSHSISFYSRESVSVRRKVQDLMYTINQIEMHLKRYELLRLEDAVELFFTVKKINEDA